MALVSLQKYLAGAGLCSRRAAKDLMREGRVAVDGVPAVKVCDKFDPEISTLTVDGKAVPGPQAPAHYMFHKPTGYLTTFDDPQGRPTVKPFLDRLPGRVYPVGRLDMDVSGLLILTNDGELAKRLMHPSYLIPKVYRAIVSGLPGRAELDTLRHGELIIDGRPAAAAKAKILRDGPDEGWLELILTEGRHRQVKRMCAAIGHPVKRLKRVAYCDLWLPGDLMAGDSRKLTPGEINHLRAQVGLDPMA
ncbi:MAG: rRNA pseudouridine synthase [Deltaproteobacteria bacterium]|jgi:pseudouridine synthase|nr:rRNA pseudouridine synthase [Deltaproteobacteria bacterium]